MKKALVLITGPYQLLQAIWYYSEHPEYEYDALVKTAHIEKNTAAQLFQWCQDCGIFHSVAFTKGTNLDSSGTQKIRFLLTMTCWFLTGRRGELTRRLIQEEIGDMCYDTVLVDSDFSVLGGAFIDHSDSEYDVVIMQEGLSDILPRKNHPDLLHSSSKNPLPLELVYYLTARMGYFNPAFSYSLPKECHCSKLCSFGSRLVYNPYTKILPLFSGKNDDQFMQVVSKTFHQMDWELFRSADVILSTTLMDAIGGGATEYEYLHDWLRETYPHSRIVIKKHPRETSEYAWDDLDLHFLEAGVPMEVIQSQVTHQKLVFCFISSSIVTMLDTAVDYSILHFDTIQSPYYNSVFLQLKAKLRIPNDKIICLGRDTSFVRLANGEQRSGKEPS